MDCRTARLLLNFARPRSTELEADEAEALANHLTDCPDCATAGKTEKSVDERLGRAMRDVPLPAGLRDRLLTNLAVQRRTWYRRRAVRAIASLAAAVVLVALCWHFWPGTRLPLDLARLHETANEPPRSAEEALQTFRSMGVAVQLPPDNLNYGLLVRARMDELEGQRVPVLEFQRGAALLRVYVLDGERFDLKPLAGVTHSGRVTVEARIPPEGRFGFLFEYSGGPLDLFLAREALPAT